MVVKFIIYAFPKGLPCLSQFLLYLTIEIHHYQPKTRFMILLIAQLGYIYHYLLSRYYT